MDNIDKKILEILQGNGRITNAELAKKIVFSPPMVLERVRKPEESGIIEKYIACSICFEKGCQTPDGNTLS